MLQRIQTIWILLALVLMSIFPFFSYITVSGLEINASIGVFSSSIDDISSILKSVNTFTLLAPFVINIVVILTLAISIFMYKKRILQARILTFSLILIFVLLCVVGYNIYSIMTSNIPQGGIAYISYYIVMPPISMILTYLAIRRVYYDEALVRAANRIR